MDIIELRRLIPVRYFDYQRLKEALNDSSNERRVIGNFIKKAHIVRVKKGLYIWGSKVERGLFSKEVLANLIYGPSYVSLEYALAYHGLIPERVEAITSVTTKRSKAFETPVGHFSYEHLYEKAYPWGFQLVRIDKESSCLMATPEKAILDTLSQRIKITDLKGADIREFLAQDLRIDLDSLKKLDPTKMLELAGQYSSPTVRLFAKFITTKWGEVHG